MLLVSFCWLATFAVFLWNTHAMWPPPPSLSGFVMGITFQKWDSLDPPVNWPGSYVTSRSQPIFSPPEKFMQIWGESSVLVRKRISSRKISKRWNFVPQCREETGYQNLNFLIKGRGRMQCMQWFKFMSLAATCQCTPACTGLQHFGTWILLCNYCWLWYQKKCHLTTSLVISGWGLVHGLQLG